MNALEWIIVIWLGVLSVYLFFVYRQIQWQWSFTEDWIKKSEIAFSAMILQGRSYPPSSEMQEALGIWKFKSPFNPFGWERVKCEDPLLKELVEHWYNRFEGETND